MTGVEMTLVNVPICTFAKSDIMYSYTVCKTPCHVAFTSKPLLTGTPNI